MKNNFAIITIFAAVFFTGSVFGNNVFAQNFPVMTPAPGAAQGTSQGAQNNTQPRVNTPPRLTWEAPLQAAVGERVTLTLRITNWSTQFPQPSFFNPEVPRGVILSQQAVTAEERESGIAIKLTLIPLTAGETIFTAQILNHENIRYEIPALRIITSP